ncbi:MAG: AMP-binding protein [Thermodesulfobacteriota bacterium]|nr:AMP-binding protein [Thermodesulfobacteriota bacterium]
MAQSEQFGDALYNKPIINGVKEIDSNFYRRFEYNSEKYPDHDAVIFLGSGFSYRCLKESGERVAAALYDLGVQRGDRVAIYMWNCVQWVMSSYAIARLGAVTVPISPVYTHTEVKYILNSAGVETIICHDTNIMHLMRILSETPVKRSIVSNIVDHLPLHKRWFGWAFDKIPNGKVPKQENIYFLPRLMRGHLPQLPEVEVERGGDLLALFYTGGTTGLPKGVGCTHSYLLDGVMTIRELWKGQGLGEANERVVLMAPMFHMLGNFMAHLALSISGTLLLMSVPHIDAMLETIQRWKATIMVGVPTLYRMILENDRLDQYDLTSLKVSLCGGDYLPSEVARRWKEITGIPLIQLYGSTEGNVITIGPIDREMPAKSVGIPLPGRDVKFVRPGTIEEVPLGEPGELLVSSEFGPKGYWNNPEETKASFIEIDGSIYYRTGDSLKRDEAGFFSFVERDTDLIKHKGYRISASEIEAVLQDHPAVIGAAAVGVPDPKTGERIKAFVVLKEDIKGVTGYDLIRWCRQRIASYKVPQYIEFRDMLPKSKVGKLLRRELREDEKRRMKKAEELK